MLIDYVYQDKLATKLKRLISQAKFRFKEADGNSIIYEQRQLDQKKILNLLSCQFLETFTNVIITGFTGSGKTFLGVPSASRSVATAKVSCTSAWRNSLKRWL